MVSVGGAADGDKKVVLTMGLTNDYDSFSPMVGVEVPDFEVWNLQYATLTDKAAADFSNIPGSRRVVGRLERRQDVHLHAPRRA